MPRSRSSRRHLTLLVTAAVAAALGLATAVPGTAVAAPTAPSAVTVDVQTYNLDLGADLTPLFGASDLPSLITGAATVYATVAASQPAERMAAIARIVAKQRPDVLGLQEVAQWATAPWSVVGGYPVAGTYTVTYDFLALLQDALAAEGVAYDAVSTDVTFNSQLAVPIAIPISVSPPVAARYIDRNVVLVRHGSSATTANEQADNFTATFHVTLLGAPIDVNRGWASIDVTQRGRTLRLFDTHLEAYGVPGTLKDQIRNPQAAELAGVVASSPYPTLVVGDINARPTMCGDARVPKQFDDDNVVAYTTLAAVPLTESWPAVHPKDPCAPASWTSGQDALTGPVSTLSHRIDDVFMSSEFSALQSFVVGDTAAELSTPHGLWPSDHASTVAKLRLDADS